MECWISLAVPGGQDTAHQRIAFMTSYQGVPVAVEAVGMEEVAAEQVPG